MSLSSKRYAGSNGSDALAGRVGATLCHSTSVLSTVASFDRARSIAFVRDPSKRSSGSSWKPTHMRSAAAAAGTSTAAARQARTSSRVTNRTKCLLGRGRKRAK